MDYNEDDNNQIMKEDKIINNSYNTGEIDYEAFTSPMKIDDRVSSNYDDQLGDNIVEKRTLKILDEEIYKEFLISPYYKKYKNPKKVDKGDMIKMYYYFKDKLVKLKAFSSVQIFIAFAEFFQINYDQLYSEIGVSDKENLLKELNSDLRLKNKIKTKKLF